VRCATACETERSTPSHRSRAAHASREAGDLSVRPSDSAASRSPSALMRLRFRTYLSFASSNCSRPNPARNSRRGGGTLASAPRAT